VYGKAAAGNYPRMTFNRRNLGSGQGLIDDPVLGQERDEPGRGAGELRFPGAKNTTAGRMPTLTLLNNLDGTVDSGSCREIA
jgi:hypothetical protein